MRDVTSSPSLVIMIRLGSLVSPTPSTSIESEELESGRSIAEQFKNVQDILARVPLGRPNREKELGPLPKGEGHPLMEDYDCIVWCKDAMALLRREKVLDLMDMCVGMSPLIAWCCA